MEFKNKIIIISFIVFFISIIAVSANPTPGGYDEILAILEENNATDMTGCCSVVLQEDGNNSILSFRRDAENAADITIEKIDWHGKQAIKQYKTSGGYFCQVIITNDGWVIGYGGIDDGPDNEKIENITGGMVNDNNTISDEGLGQIQSIKEPYGLGHVVIKAPNGNYGIATDKGHFTGKLAPGEYLSMPNRYTYFRSGNIDLNTSDKIEVMNELAITDGFGLTRRDVTTFDFDCTNTTNVTNVYVSNDDGSYFGMSTGGLADNINFTGKYISAGDIPIAPNYKHIGNITFEADNDVSTNDDGGSFNFMNLLVLIGIAVVIAVVIFFSYHVIRVLRFRRRYYKR